MHLTITRLLFGMTFLFWGFSANAQVVENPSKLLSYQELLKGNTKIVDGYQQKAYVEKLPLFCKLEYKLEEKYKVPVRFRLGSLDYVNKLEGKNK